MRLFNILICATVLLSGCTTRTLRTYKYERREDGRVVDNQFSGRRVIQVDGDFVVHRPLLPWETERDVWSDGSRCP